jgi:hypothetical protein
LNEATKPLVEKKDSKHQNALGVASTPDKKEAMERFLVSIGSLNLYSLLPIELRKKIYERAHKWCSSFALGAQRSQSALRPAFGTCLKYRCRTADIPQIELLQTGFLKLFRDARFLKGFQLHVSARYP